MLSEGVDIPRLRVGRLRHDHHHRALLPAGGRAPGALDPRASGRSRATCSSPTIPGCALTPWRSPSSGATACAATTPAAGIEELEEPLEREAPEPPDDQLSLFAAISAVPVGGADGAPRGPARGRARRAGRGGRGRPASGARPRAAARPGAPAAGRPTTASRCVPRERRRRLRDANAALVRHISRITGLSHSQVNAELNRRVGIERVGEATLDQLERRRDQAARWLAAA